LLGLGCQVLVAGKVGRDRWASGLALAVRGAVRAQASARVRPSRQSRSRGKGALHARHYCKVLEIGFDSFFHQRFSRTVVLLVAMGASQADAEDATQEAMIPAWNQWDSIREPAAWVRTVAVRSYLRMVRTRGTQMVTLDESVPDPVRNDGLGSFEEEQRQVLRLLRALPSGQRAVTALYYDGLNCEEIAAVLGKTAATVRSNLRYARQSLKEVIASERLSGYMPSP
jgi:RNA polymerase sigma factor (sigma-70 family)